MSGCREALFESYVNMLHQHCDEAPGTYSVLQEVLQRSINEFPNNMYLLTTAAKLQVSTVFSLKIKMFTSRTLWKAIVIIVVIYYCKSSLLVFTTHKIVYTLPFIIIAQYCHNFTSIFSITWCLSAPYAFTSAGLSMLHLSCKVTIGFDRHHFIVIIIISIYCNWLLPGGSGYFTCKQNMELVTIIWMTFIFPKHVRFIILFPISLFVESNVREY